jgi:crotonobetainyl-CoA:carnitine CoA-transferase CaiB-like acyl-CoA transferase
VFIQNLAPGAAARLGLGADALLAKHPRLIVCDISGYGDAGPYAHKKAYDLLVQSERAVVSVTGTPESPAKVGLSLTDIGTGLHAYAAILGALYPARAHGQGHARRGDDVRDDGRVDDASALLHAFRGQPRRSAAVPTTRRSCPTDAFKPAMARA